MKPLQVLRCFARVILKRINMHALQVEDAIADRATFERLHVGIEVELSLHGEVGDGIHVRPESVFRGV